MSYYEPQAWQAPVTPVWEQPAPPSRSGTSSVSQRDDSIAFASQFDEVDRAIDNLVKSGKIFHGMARRDSLPMIMPRPFPEFADPRLLPAQRHSMGDFDTLRPHPAANLQGFYAAQRFQGPRASDAEQIIQAKRRMAAQRERDLRNYHQEQQYHRSILAEMSGSKSERSLSPAATTMSEEGRRELISRQHRALYGNDSPTFFPSGPLSDSASDSRPAATPTTTASDPRGPSPQGIDAYRFPQPQQVSSAESSGNTAAPGGPSPAVPTSRSQASSPSTGGNISYGIFDGNCTQASSPAGRESPSHQIRGPAVGPIGSRPSQNKRTMTPLPSPLSYGFGTENTERSTLAASNPAVAAASSNREPRSVSLGGWSSDSGVWRTKSLQASVWG